MKLRELEDSTKLWLFIGGVFAVSAPTVDAMWSVLGFAGIFILAAVYSEFEGEKVSKISDRSPSSNGEHQYSVSDLQNMSPTQFESVVQTAWENIGYDTEMTPAGPDEGIDLLADNGKEFVAIQAKKYTQGNKVGGPTVRKSVGAADQVGADRVIVVTTSEFTDPAYSAANQISTDVELVNGDDLTRML